MTIKELLRSLMYEDALDRKIVLIDHKEKKAYTIQRIAYWNQQGYIILNPLSSDDILKMIF